MMFPSKPLGMLLCCGAAFLSTGCFIETTETGGTTEPVPTGYVTVRWSIENSTSPSICRLFGASELELLIYDRYRHKVAEIYRRCGDFDLTVELPEGAYSANATLVNGSRRAVSTTLPISNIRIRSGEALVIRVDFPATSRR